MTAEPPNSSKTKFDFSAFSAKNLLVPHQTANTQYNESWSTLDKHEIKIQGPSLTCDTKNKKYVHYTAMWMNSNIDNNNPLPGTGSTGLLKAGDHYWTIQFGELSGDQTAVGISSNHFVKRGWGTRGLLYTQGNLTNGISTLRPQFGDPIMSGETIGILVSFSLPTFEKEKLLRVYFFQNGRPLGLAFEVPRSTFPHGIFPMVQFGKGKSSARIQRENQSKIPPFYQIRRPRNPNMGIVGYWMLGATLFRGQGNENLSSLENNLRMDIYERSKDCYEIYLDDYVPIPLNPSQDPSQQVQHHHGHRGQPSKSRGKSTLYKELRRRDSNTESFEVEKTNEDKTWTMVSMRIEEDNVRRPYTASYDLKLLSQPPPFRHVRHHFKKLGPEEVEIIKIFQEPDSIIVDHGYLKMTNGNFTGVFVPRALDVENFRGNPFDLKNIEVVSEAETNGPQFQNQNQTPDAPLRKPSAYNKLENKI